MPDEKKPVQPHAIIHGVPKHPEALTVPVPAIPGPLAAMLKEIQDGVRTGFERTNANLDTLSHSFDGLQDRVARLEEREAKSRTGPNLKAVVPDGPQKTYSGPINALKDTIATISSSDATQNLTIESLKAEIIAVQQAQEAAKVERAETAEKVTAVYDTVVQAGSWVARAWNAPITVVLRKVTTAAIIAYAAARGIQIGK